MTVSTGSSTTRPRVLRGRVVDATRDLADGVVELVDGRISRVVAAADHPEPHTLPAPTGLLILPGLLDVHCHGGAGESFPNSDAAHASLAAQHHREFGTTGLLGSLVSAPEADLVEQAGILADLVERGDLLGVHLEGPFLSAARCGAQDPTALVPGDVGLFDRVCDAARGTVASITLAPETPNRAEVVARARERGVLVSFGHTDADAAATARAVRESSGGPLSATHLFNGMPPLHHRRPGPAGACLAAAARGELVVELVADGVHLAPETIGMVFDTVGPDAVTLISDAMAAAGMADGTYRLGPLDVHVDDGVARLVGEDGAPGAIAGGTSRLVDVLRFTVVHAGVPVRDAVTAATRTPARLLGLAGERGGLGPGMRADVLVTDRALHPHTVFVAGVEQPAPGAHPPGG